MFRNSNRLAQRSITLLLLAAALLAPAAATASPVSPAHPSQPAQLYLPRLLQPNQGSPTPPPGGVQVHSPYFSSDRFEQPPFGQLAIFWFGQVTPTTNYADVRIGHTDEALTVALAVFDRRLSFDAAPAAGRLHEADAATLYLAPPAGAGGAAEAYRFVAQLSGAARPEERGRWQAAYQRSEDAWTAADLPFATQAGWRGEGLNDATDDRGWTMRFTIPFAALGAEPNDTPWRIAVTLHDRDGQTLAPDQSWPAGALEAQPATWARLGFGLPIWSPPALPEAGAVTIRHRLDGASVPSAAVGGHSTCGSLDGANVDFFGEWGELSADFYDPDLGVLNVQNQSDVADWPCFSKAYLTFPLDGLPPGSVVLSATLTLHQFGQSGAPGQAQRSLIQVLRVAEPADLSTLTWNNAPPALENVAQSWVEPLEEFPGWPGAPHTWELSAAAAAAHSAGAPLHVALYSADSPYHSGKYFVSSEVGLTDPENPDWNEAGRPTLRITYALR